MLNRQDHLKIGRFSTGGVGCGSKKAKQERVCFRPNSTVRHTECRAVDSGFGSGIQSGWSKEHNHESGGMTAGREAGFGTEIGIFDFEKLLCDHGRSEAAHL